MSNLIVASISLALALSLTGGSAAPVIDARDAAEFARCVDASATLERLATGLKFTEGPVWLQRPDGGFLVFSDIPADALMQWTPAGGVRVYRQPSRNINGNTVDREGRLVSAEHSGRQISVTARDGTVKSMVSTNEGKRFNSPNDVVVKSDGSVWFTDPPYGLPAGAKKEQAGNFVYRHDPRTGNTTVISREHDMPNGLAFSPDEKRLYVADSGKPRHIRVYDLQPDGTVGAGRIFCTIDKGAPDGIRCDTEGRVWSSAGDGVHVFAPDGRLIGKILVPESAANLCFGGADGRELFITARKSLYRIRVLAAGAR